MDLEDELPMDEAEGETVRIPLKSKGLRETA